MTIRSKCLILSLLLLGGSSATVRADEPAKEQPDEASARHLSRYFRGLEFHPVGWTVPDHRFRFTNLIRMTPPGFRSDRFDQWFAPTVGLGKGWEATLGVTGAERLGSGGEALFYGAGIQKQVVTEHRGLPAVSVGAYGMAGPHDHQGGRLYVAATHRLLGSDESYYALDLHGGLKYELYDSDDYGSSSGIRPFVGVTAPVGRRVFLSADFSPSQAWQRTKMYSLGATVRVYKRFGVSGGIRNNGFKTHPFIGISL